MSYKIAVSKDKKYIEVKSTGVMNNAVARQQNKEVQSLGFALNIDRFLVDVSESRYEEGIVGHYEFINNRKMPENQYNRYARIALLVHPDDDSHNFVETVSRNAGFDITIFRDRDAAVHHLTHDL
jgi:hypothetical protein